MICVTDSGQAPRSYWQGMGKRQKMRSGLSAMLAIVLLSCAQTGLATPVLAAHAARCHARMSQVRQPAMPSSCKHHASARPCCPSNSLTAPSICMDPGCCRLSSQPAQPLAFVIVPPGPLTVELSNVRSADVDSDQLRRSRRTLLAADSPRFRKPVLDQKADLRI